MRKFLAILAIFILSFAIRWYTLPDNLFFDYEQGRDALAIKDIYTFKHFPLLGPKTDIDGVFHGSTYYYIMALPYGLTGGNPLIAAFFLVLASSLVPLIMFLLIKDILDERWGLVAGILTAISYQYILFSRWLSNISLATVFISLTFLFLWRFHKFKKNKDFIFSIIFASVACQFEIILIVQFLFVYLALFLLKLIKLPSIKTLIVPALFILILFSPFVLFDFRNQHITTKAVLSVHQNSSTPNPIWKYIVQMFTVYRETLIDMLAFWQTIFGMIFLLSLFLAFKEKIFREKIIFFVIWVFMSVPLIFLGPKLPQLYVASGLGLIGLLVIALNNLYKYGKFKYFSLLSVLLIILNLSTTLNKLKNNKDIFYIPENGVNLKNQKEIIDYVHKKSEGQNYNFRVFTIPYLHPVGWEYLHGFYYPNDSTTGAKITFIAIENKIPTYWERRWVAEIGNTKLLEEKRFGQLRLQERIDER